MKIVVTGGGGYIGGVIATQLAEAGHEVIVVDKSGDGKAKLPTGVRFIQQDIRQVGEVFSREQGIEAVIHCAAYIAAGESMSRPEIYWENNTTNSITLLTAMREHGIRRLIFSSTAAVYGNPETVPITEDAATHPTNTYGMTKLAVDMAIASECQAHGLAATSLRYFNVAGAYEACGEQHTPETHLIPLALAAAAGDREGLIMYGDDYPTEDGTCVRDYIHVADLARAHLLALANLRSGMHSIYNLGNGSGFSNRQVIEAVEAVTGKEVPLTAGPRREGDPAVLIASSDQARKELGWIPQKPRLHDIVADAWEFYKSNA